MFDDTPSRIWHEILDRPEGPLAMRFYLQPVMSIIFAIRDGLKDAKSGKPPYFWTIFTDRTERVSLLREGWKSVGKIFILAIILDTIYQIVVLGGLRPVEGVIVSVVLALVPYLLIRGPVDRLARSVTKSHLPQG